jgi:hypothetical protein
MNSNYAKFMRRGFLLSILLFLFFGCSKEDCNAQIEDATCLEEMGCSNAVYQLSVESTKEFELVRTQEDYNLLVKGACMASIDWTQFDLVIGMKGLTNGVSTINKTTRLDCATKQRILYVEIVTNETLIAPIITWNALLPKLQDTETLFVDVQIVQ